MTEDNTQKIALYLDVEEGNTIIAALGSTPAYYNSLIQSGVISDFLLGGNVVGKVKDSCQEIINKISSQASNQTQIKGLIVGTMEDRQAKPTAESIESVNKNTPTVNIDNSND